MGDGGIDERTRVRDGADEPGGPAGRAVALDPDGQVGGAGVGEGLGGALATRPELGFTSTLSLRRAPA